ncbi:MAK10-like protein [Tanacetum coccineum]
MASQDARLSMFESDFEQQQSEMTNKIDTVLKAITNRIEGALPSDTVKNLKLNFNSTTLVLSVRSYPTIDPQCSSHPSISINAVKTCSKEENWPYLGLADGTKSHPVGIVKNVEVRIGKLKLLNNFYVIDMKKDLETPLLVGRGFLATANAVINCRKSKIAVGEGITRSVFGVKGVNLEIARDTEINPFKDVLVFRRMVEFLGALPINLKGNMWESEDLIEDPINWDKPPKDGDGEWHAKIRIIDPDGEEFTKTQQSISTTRKLSERESPGEIINLDHFYDT